MEYVEEQEYEPGFEEEPEPVPADGALRSRMQVRAEKLEQATTERFPIPGYDGLLEVELRVSGVRQASKIAKRNERTRDEGTRNLYVMCDLILSATVGFWEIKPDGETKVPVQTDWIGLARMVEGCPDDPSPRQALLFLIKEHRVAWLYADWETWMRSVGTDISEELRSDFVPTG